MLSVLFFSASGTYGNTRGHQSSRPIPDMWPLQLSAARIASSTGAGKIWIRQVDSGGTPGRTLGPNSTLPALLTPAGSPDGTSFSQ